MVSGAIIEHRPVSVGVAGNQLKHPAVCSPQDRILHLLRQLIGTITSAQGKVDFRANHEIRASVFEVLQRLGLCEETVVDLQEPAPSVTCPSDTEAMTLVPTRVITARSCIICGRDDRPGQQRRSGFKCTECIGIPNTNRFFVKVTEDHHVERGVDEDGSKTINNYSFVRTLGVGSYGKVKLCLHVVSNQPYAAKIIDKDVMRKNGEKAMELLRREVRILKNLHHPNIVQTYEIIDDPGSSKIYIIMEFMPGGQIFSSRSDGSPPIEINRLKKYIVQIARGLQYLHNHGLVHSDVKPENILLDSRDNVKLVDFGISTMCSSDCSYWSRSGTPCFMPPEAYAWLEDDNKTFTEGMIGAAVDVWAFGVSVYLMAFGSLPFTGDSLQQLGEAIRTQEPPMDTPHAGLVQLLRGMLAKDPAQRMSINDVLAHPFLSDIRIVKGQAVETVKVKISALESAHNVRSELSLSPVEGDSRGVCEVLKFLHEHGPDVQVVRPNDHSCTLYSLRSPKG